MLKPEVPNTAPAEGLPYPREFSYNPNQNTPEPANQGLRDFLKRTAKCVGRGLEMQSAGS